jgi:hypothetical protein
VCILAGAGNSPTEKCEEEQKPTNAVMKVFELCQFYFLFILDDLNSFLLCFSGF